MQSSTVAILQSANLFLFTMHNPIRFIDPTGLFAVPIWTVSLKCPKKGTCKLTGQDGVGGAGGNMARLTRPAPSPAPVVPPKPGVTPPATVTAPKPGSIAAKNATAPVAPKTPGTASTTQVTTITGNNIPNQHGTPNSVTRLVDSSGKVIQERFFGSDGRAFMDIDFRHPGHHGLSPGQGHIHMWNWASGVGIRCKEIIPLPPMP